MKRDQCFFVECWDIRRGQSITTPLISQIGFVEKFNGKEDGKLNGKEKKTKKNKRR